MIKKMKNKLALFDFDFTISTEDSLISMVSFLFGNLRTHVDLVRLWPEFIGSKLKITGQSNAKEVLLQHYFMNWTEERFREMAFLHAHEGLSAHERALEKISWHKSEGHDVYIVTASLDPVVRPWTDLQGINLIATQMEFLHGKVTGKLASPNCKGVEKVNRIRHEINLPQYDYIYAYGNTKHDRPMMALGDEKHYRPFVRFGWS